MALNVFIDPSSPTSIVQCHGWNLIIFNDLKSIRVSQEDNSLTLQPKGMQMGYMHEVHGVYSKYWRIVITFRNVDEQLAKIDKQNYEEVPPATLFLNSCGKLITSGIASPIKNWNKPNKNLKSSFSRMEQR